MNKTYRADCENKQYVIRINGQQSSQMGLDPILEAEACQQASGFGVAPKVYNPLDAGDYLITEFFAGKLLSAEDVRKPEIVRLVVDAMKQIHDHVTVNRTFSVFDNIDRYWEGIRQTALKLPDGFGSILDRSAQIRKVRMADKTFGKVFCHNDLWQNNILFDGKRICFIDWELCGFGDAYRDLADIPRMVNTSFEEERFILRSYFGYFEMEMWHTLQDMKYVSMVMEAAWSFYHAGLSDDTHNSDYNYYKAGNDVVEMLLQGQNHF